MSLRDYLPSSDEVNRCIKNEAEGAHEAVLLAVHQSSPLSYRAVSSNESVATNEQELLEFLLTRHVASGALVVPVTGASGVGKSHLVRIIDARLRNSPEARRYLIIRIPKSASLRRVVELILEPLPDQSYSAVKAAFKTALAAVDVETAAIRFQAEIEIALRERAVELRAEVLANPTQVKKEQLDHAQRLPLLLGDIITAQHFRQSVFPRIIHRAVAGSSSEEVDSTEGQFSASDLNLPASIDLGKAGNPASVYYRMGLQAREGRGREVAAEVLNTAVDQATRQLFNLHKALGQFTLEEVILEIRRLLLKEKRELILLVEDFAALTGIQDTLAKVLIQEGVRDGVTQYATMRSVIAVTDGYLVGRDTLATRAMRVWTVESKIHSDEEILSRTRALVASYLNAARWGEIELVQRYSREASTAVKNGDWLPVFRASNDADTDRLIGAFGTEQEIPLFPFTESAIEYLARAALTQAEGLIFNPRFIINEVLRKVLLPARTTFDGNHFPPRGIDSTAPSADVQEWLATVNVSEEVRQKYRVTVMVWGNNPKRRSDIGSIPKEVFEVFGLKSPGLETPHGGKKQRARGPEPPPPPPPPSPELDRIRATLENWVQGTPLPQQLANAIRTRLAAALNEQFDWNAQRSLRTDIEPNQISIPKAAGEGRIAGANVLLAPDHTDPDGRLRGDLMALLRLRQINAGQSNYREYEVDRGRVSNLVDRLMPQAVRVVRDRGIKQCQMAILALSTNSGALGLVLRGRTAKAINAYLFGQVNEPDTVPDDAPVVFKDWKALQGDIWRIRSRLTHIVRATAGCFQGSGDTANGVDIVRLVECYPGSEARFELATLERLSPEERQTLTAMSESRVAARLGMVAKELRRLRVAITGKLGKDFDKNSIAGCALELAEEMGRGAWDSNTIGATLPEFRRLCEEFRAAAIKEALDSGIRMDSPTLPDEEPVSDVPRIASLNIRPVLIAERFLSLANAVVVAANGQAANLENQYRGVDPVAKANAILQLFDALDRQVEKFGQGARNAVA